MSRATVRAAVQTWIAPPNVTNLVAVHRSQPHLIQGGEFTPTPGVVSSAVAVVHLGNEEEKRVALGGAHSGMKLITYKVSVILRFISRQPDAESAMDDYDTLVESLKNRIRADRTLGTAGSNTPIFQAGEGSGENTPDLDMASDLPRQDKGTTYIWGALNLTVSEMLAT